MKEQDIIKIQLKSKQSCKNCKYAEWEYTEKGNIKRSRAGTCHRKVPAIIKPSCMKIKISKSAIWADGKDGSTCMLWEEK